MGDSALDTARSPGDIPSHVGAITRFLAPHQDEPSHRPSGLRHRRNRDRFVLSAGHESALLYALLVLRGILGLDDLRAFRQLGSKTPGHPKHDITKNVKATTGPLGQGFAMAGGMAVAEAFLRARLDEETAGHFTYVLASDGDLQEPVCLGSAALCGRWGLGRLIVFYDSNKVQLVGSTERIDTTNYKALFKSMH